jgi:hypothetical protein
MSEMLPPAALSGNGLEPESLIDKVKSVRSKHQGLSLRDALAIARGEQAPNVVISARPRRLSRACPRAPESSCEAASSKPPKPSPSCARSSRR